MLFTGYVVVDKLGIRVAEAQKEASDARMRAEQETVKRLELEKSIAPGELRHVERGGISIIDPLKSFAGTEVILWYFRDDEPLRAIANIDGLRRKAGWNSGTKGAEKRELSHAFFGGVVVEPHISTAGGDTNAAADALVEFLRANNWLARAQFQSIPQVM